MAQAKTNIYNFNKTFQKIKFLIRDKFNSNIGFWVCYLLQLKITY